MPPPARSSEQPSRMPLRRVCLAFRKTFPLDIPLENRFDDANMMPMLLECWVAKASAKQRRGRAGRVRPGVCFHMCSSGTFQDVLSEFQVRGLHPSYRFNPPPPAPACLEMLDARYSVRWDIAYQHALNVRNTPIEIIICPCSTLVEWDDTGFHPFVSFVRKASQRARLETLTQISCPK